MLHELPRSLTLFGHGIHKPSFLMTVYWPPCLKSTGILIWRRSPLGSLSGYRFNWPPCLDMKSWPPYLERAHWPPCLEKQSTSLSVWRQSPLAFVSGQVVHWSLYLMSNLNHQSGLLFRIMPGHFN